LFPGSPLAFLTSWPIVYIKAQAFKRLSFPQQTRRRRKRDTSYNPSRQKKKEEEEKSVKRRERKDIVKLAILVYYFPPFFSIDFSFPYIAPLGSAGDFLLVS
jgi:hypothetical protein